MKNFGALTLLTILAVGCVSDNASVAPRTTVRLHRTGKVPGDLAAAEQTAGTNTLFGSNALSNASSPQGIAPYITQASTAAALSETNSLSTVNTPRAATPAGTDGTAAVPGAVSGPAPGSPSGGAPPAARRAGCFPPPPQVLRVRHRSTLQEAQLRQRPAHRLFQAALFRLPQALATPRELFQAHRSLASEQLHRDRKSTR